MIVTDSPPNSTADDPTRSRPRSAARALLVIALVASVIPVGELSVHLAPPGSHVAAWWPAAGISVVALCLATPRWRPLVLVGLFVASLAANLYGGRDLDVALGFATANTAESAVVILVLARAEAFRLRRHPGTPTPPPALVTFADLLRFFGAAALGAVVAGLLAGLTVALLDDADLWVVARAVAASHAAAVLVIGPLGLRLPSVRAEAAPTERVVVWVTLTSLVFAAYAPGQALPLAFLPFPALAWGALRLSPRELTIALPAVAVSTTLLTAAGDGPLTGVVSAIGAAPEMVGTLLQAEMVATALVVLPLLLVRAQRAAALSEAVAARDLVGGILDATTGTAILGTDLCGRIEFVNVGAQRLSGFSAEDAVGGSLAVVADPDGGSALTFRRGDPDTVALEVLAGAMLDREVERGATSVADWPFLRADGTRRILSLRISHRRGPDGTVIGYLGVADDVTDRRRHEAELALALEEQRRLVDQLAHADQTKNDFMATMSHELRTPVTSILGYSQLLRADGVELPPVHQHALERIERNSRRLTSLIEDLLMVSQLDLGHLRLHLTPLDLSEVVLTAVDTANASHHGCPVQVRIGHLHGPAVVQGDAENLERALLSLMTNAVKFSEGRGAVTVDLDQEGCEAVVRVTDDGVGLSEDDQRHLFDRFYRGSGARRMATQGAGIGLSIAHALVSAHGGRLEVRSALDEGTTVAMRVPLCRPVDAEGPTLPAPALPAEQESAGAVSPPV